MLFFSGDTIDIIHILASCTPSYFLLKRYLFFFLRGFKKQSTWRECLNRPFHHGMPQTEMDYCRQDGENHGWFHHTTCHPQNRTQMPKVFSGMVENSQIIDKDCIIKNMGTFLQEMLTWRQSAIFLCSFLFCSGCSTSRL